MPKIFLLLLVSFFAQALENSVIEGKVAIRGADEKLIENASNVLIFLDELPPQKYPLPPIELEMKSKNKTFIPEILPVLQGQRWRQIERACSVWVCLIHDGHCRRHRSGIDAAHKRTTPKPTQLHRLAGLLSMPLS